MSVLAKTKDAAKTRRILIPKEHGAWGIMLVSFAVGLAVAGEWNTQAFLLLGAILRTGLK